MKQRKRRNETETRQVGRLEWSEKACKVSRIFRDPGNRLDLLNLLLCLGCFANQTCQNLMSWWPLTIWEGIKSNSNALWLSVQSLFLARDLCCELYHSLFCPVLPITISAVLYQMKVKPPQKMSVMPSHLITLWNNQPPTSQTDPNKVKSKNSYSCWHLLESTIVIVILKLHKHQKEFISDSWLIYPGSVFLLNKWTKTCFTLLIPLYVWGTCGLLCISCFLLVQIKLELQH